MVLRWPVIGRDPALARCGALLADPAVHAVIVSGSLGVGKTHLLGACARHSAEAGFVALHATAHRSSAGFAFGALSPLLPAGTAMLDNGVPLLRQAAEALTAQAEGRSLLLVIDDAHLLDEVSSLLVYQMVANRMAFVIATVLTGAPTPEPIARLWQDGVADRIDLAPLDRNAVHQLLPVVLEGPVESAAADALFDATGGNPMALRELVRGSLESAALTRQRGLWRMTGVPAPSMHLHEVVAAQLAGLNARRRSTLDLVAIAEPIGLDEALRLGADELDDLEAGGLIEVRRSGRRIELTMAHPYVGEVLRAAMPTMRGRRLRRAVADAITEAGARRRNDAMAVATLTIEGDGVGDRKVLVAAAREAFAANDYSAAQRFADAAEAQDSQFETRLLLEQVRYREGAGSLDPADVAAGSSDAEVALETMSLAATAFWHHGRHDDAEALLGRQIAKLAASDWRDELVAMRATLDVNAAQPVRALQRLPDTPPAGARPFVVMSLARALALPHLGRAPEAMEIFEPARVTHASIDNVVALYQVSLLSSAESSALTQVGRLQEAAEVAEAAYNAAGEIHDTAGQAFNALCLGRIQFARGRPTSALRWSREGAVLMEAIGHRGPLRWALGGIALAAATRRDVEVASEALARVDIGADHPAVMLRSDIERARAWLAVARNDPQQARDVLAALARWCEDRGLLALEIETLHDLARLDRARAVADRVNELGEQAQGLWLAALVTDIVAMANRNPDALTESSSTLDHLGASLLAAEAAQRASVALAADGQQRESAAWRRRASTLLSECEGAHTPALVRGDGPVPLTDREREIALLASTGLTSRTIGERLYLSVRTVDNALARVYGKLGITERSAIGEALGVP